MVSHVHSFMFSGVDVTDVNIQVSFSSGLPAFTIVGLADKAVAESRERVRSALNSIGISLPAKRITVNLAPADLAKEGSHFDLGIALGILSELGVIGEGQLDDFIAMGELSLDSSLMPVSGILPASIGAAARGKGIICPKQCGSEAAWGGENIDILAPASLLCLINHFKGTQILGTPERKREEEGAIYPDMSDIKGQETAKRALEIAAAGGHNMLMVGPPGSGKSMLAARIGGVLPELTPKEMLEVSMIHSIAGNLGGRGLISNRPFRDPHHNCSMAAMVGGGAKAKPGEVTLAHKGILFLDELAEFPRQVLDSLRQPLETKQVSVARVQSHVTYPADFQLIAAMNPCRCGYLDDASRACNKAPKCAVDYQSKISGPLLDRIDIHVEVPAVKPTEIYDESRIESSAIVKSRVEAARIIQNNRFDSETNLLNSKLDGDLIAEICVRDEGAEEILKKGVEVMGLSMRGYNRVLRVARTIADLEGSEIIKKHHMAESLSYRQINFKQPTSNLQTA